MKSFATAAALVLAAGCAAYSWKPRVEESMRSVFVAEFANDSSVTGLGAATARELLRELQREGTMRVSTPEDAAVEVQGSVSCSAPSVVAYERSTGARARERLIEACATVSIIDKAAGSVLVDSRKYRARATFLAADDVLTAARDASGRIAEDLARQIADDLASGEWQRRAQ